ncbi:immune inhibitor A [candidate division WOR-3 bacterium]|nr:immune inhibitor A [candidate division WOR-3 bacterium]
MKVLSLILITSILFAGSEMDRLKNMYDPENAVKYLVAMQEIYRRYPEAKEYISRPSYRDIIGEIRAKRGKQAVDTIRVLAIRVEFVENPQDSLATGNGKMRTTRALDEDSIPIPPFEYAGTDSFGHNLYYDPPHTRRYFEHQIEFVRNYFLRNTNGRFYVDFTVGPEAESLAYQLPHQIYYYGDPANYIRGLLTLLRDALIACDQQDTIRMGEYDVYIVFHAGCSYQSSYVWGDAPYDILSCSITGLDGFFGMPVWVDNGTHPITDGIIFPESDFKYGVPSFIQGGLCHEFGHQVGFYDLYDVSGYTIGVGGWALMGTGNWNMNGLLPPNVSAWHREYLSSRYGCPPGPTELKNDSTNVEVYFLGGSDSTRKKMYRVPINTSEYFLISNRFVYANPDTTTYKFEIYSDDSTLHIDSTGVRTWKDGVLTFFDDYDWGLPPDSMTGGLAIWHIDERKVEQDSLHNEINVGDIKGVDMEEADGVQDFETKVWLVTDMDAAFFGSPYDVFYEGSQESFSPKTIPNTNDNRGNHSHINIYDVSSSDTVMRFSIKFNFKRNGFPIKCASFFDVSSPTLLDDYIVVAAMDTLIETKNHTTFGGVVSVVDSIGEVKWRRNILDANLFASPGIGDIDGDGKKDIVVCPFYVYLYDTDKKKPIIYKSDLKQEKDSVYLIKGDVWAYNEDGDWILYLSEVTDGEIICTPLLADVDSDGKDEIFFGCNDGFLYGYQHPGNPIPGFPVNLHQWIWATPVWDSLASTLYAVSGDGRLFAIEISDSVYTKWAALEPYVGQMSSSSPVVKYGDGIIVSRGDGWIYSVSDSGTINWKRNFGAYSFYTSPAIAEENTIIVVGGELHSLNINGAEAPGFPIKLDNKAIQSSPVVGDIDGDGEYEIVIGLDNGSVIAYSSTGEIVDFFPLSTGDAVLSTPLLCDIDKDGLVDIMTGCDDGLLYGWEFPWNYGEMPWPMLHKNPENNGIFDDIAIGQLIPSNIFEHEEFYIYPNPVLGDGGWIRYTSGDADEVKITILDIAGNIKCEFEGEIGNGDEAVQVRIPIGRLTGGIYIARVEVLIGNRSMIRFKKFSLIK